MRTDGFKIDFLNWGFVRAFERLKENSLTLTTCCDGSGDQGGRYKNLVPVALIISCI